MKKLSITEAIKEFGIKELVFDSRKVTPGSAFFCIQYAQNYIEEALENGAALVVCNHDPVIPEFSARKYPESSNNKNLQSVPDIFASKNSGMTVVVHDVRDALAEAAAFLYPNKPKYVVAVTGTSGKTSVVDYYRQIGTALGLKVASMGTMGIRCSDVSIEDEAKQYSILTTGLNTPDVITMYKVLNMLALRGVTHLVFEASSHGLDQKRILGVPVSVAGFTNFSQDHLDYHHTMEAYKFAKLRLFSENLIDGGRAIVADKVMDDDIARLSVTNLDNGGHGINITTVGEHGDVQILSSHSSMTEQQFVFKYKNKNYEVRTSVIGGFQASNIIMAALMLEACNIQFDDIFKFISHITPVTGRLERVTSLQHPWQIFVDYAHKPNAFESVFAELRNICKGRLIAVFGCGGDRDRGKRPIMGRIAQTIADIVIIADDNPRTEDPKIIRQEVMVGCPNAIEIPDRAEAIKYAVSLLKKGDVLLIAGKGHENYQIVGDQHIHFSDVEEARKYL